jgi:hypothetical protein
MNGSPSAPAKFREACLTCPQFITTAEFLPQHRKQLDDTRALIARAETDAHTRLAEMNRVETNLLTIITTLEADHDCQCTGQRNMLREGIIRWAMTTATTSSPPPSVAAPTPSNALAEPCTSSAKPASGIPSPRSRPTPASPAHGSTPSPNYATNSAD